MPPPIANNPKYHLWIQRTKKDGLTAGNRQMTDQFIEEELPQGIKQPIRDITESYRSIMDFPSEVLRVIIGLGILGTMLYYSPNYKRK